MKPPFSLTLILAGLGMLGPFGIDTYLPSFPSIAGELDVDIALVQQTLSLYLLCFAGMMLFHGTLSDSFGRKPVIIVSLIVFTLASLGAAVAPNLGVLLAFRALQGLSAGAGTVVGRAMIRDMLSGAAAQKMLSEVTIVFGIAPAIAPVIGGWLEVGFGWRSVFLFLTAVGILLLVCCWRHLPESLPREKRQPLLLGQITRNYLTALKHPRFMLMILAFAFMSNGFFAYIASAPYFVIDVLKLPETAFAWLFIPIVGGMVFGAAIASRLAHRWEPRRMIRTGFSLMACAALFNLGYNLLFTAAVPWAVLPLAILTTGVSLASPGLMVLMLNIFPEMRGLASSMQAFSQMLLSSVVAAVIAPFIGHSALRMALFMLLTISCSIGCLWLLSRMTREEK